MAQLLMDWAPGRFEGSFVTRRGATVEGTVDAGVVVLDDSASVVVESGARITGDLVLAADKAAPRIGFGMGSSQASVSARITVENRGGSSALGRPPRSVEGFSLPRLVAVSHPTKSGTVILQGKVATPADWSTVGNFTLRKPQTTVAIPPGGYGDLVVAEGTIVLGIAGSANPVRYEFRSVDVRLGGNLEVAGPVVVTMASGAIWRGRVGNSGAPLWLDLRVTDGDVVVAGTGSFYGFLTAPTSKVTVMRGGILNGGAASDRLEIRAGANAKAIDPDWSVSASATTRPRFPQKALRLQSKVPTLNAGFRHSYFPAISYIDDVPFVMLAEGKRPREHPLAHYEERRAFFEACCTLFVDTGFDRGVIVLAGYSADPVRHPPAVQNVALTRQQFEAQLVTVGGKGADGDNISVIKRNPVRLDEFHDRIFALEVATTGGSASQ